MAAPVPESVASATGTSGTSVEVSKPSGTVDGDWLIAVLSVRDKPTSLTAPGGWTAVVTELDSDSTDGNHLTSVWKKKASSEGSSYTFSWTAGGDHTCTISRYSGGDSTDIIDASATQEEGSQSVGDIVCPAVTTSTADCLIVRIAAQNQGGKTRSAPGSHTERWSIESIAITAGCWQGGATATQASAGSSGTATWSSDSNRSGAGITLALKPAASGGTTVEGALTAAATADDSFATLLTALASLAAAIEAGESWATTLLAQAAVSEDATTSDAYAALATLLATLESAAAAADTMAAVATLQAELTAGAEGNATWAAVAALLAEIAAAVEVGSTFEGGLSLEAATSEGVTASDTWAADVVTSVLAAFAADTEAGATWAASVAALADWSEPAAAGDALAALLLGTATISEGVATGSTFAAMATLGAAWDGAAEFGAAFSATLPGQTGAFLRVGVDLTPRLVAGIDIVPRLRAGVEVNPSDG